MDAPPRLRSEAHRLRQLDPGRRVTLVEALLAAGADPDGRIATATVASANRTLKDGAFNYFGVGTGNLQGATALWVAAWTLHDRQQSGSPDLIRALLAAGADFRLTTADKTTPLMAAAGLGHRGGPGRVGMVRGPVVPLAEEGVKVLVEAGADLNAANEAGFSRCTAQRS